MLYVHNPTWLQNHFHGHLKSSRVSPASVIIIAWKGTFNFSSVAPNTMYCFSKCYYCKMSLSIYFMTEYSHNSMHVPVLLALSHWEKVIHTLPTLHSQAYCSEQSRGSLFVTYLLILKASYFQMTPNSTLHFFWSSATDLPDTTKIRRVKERQTDRNIPGFTLEWTG